MGNSVKNTNLRFYSKQMHPIQGCVEVYSIVGEGKFMLLKNVNMEKQTVELLQKIASVGSQKLLTFYNAEENKTFNFQTCHSGLKQNPSHQYRVYWQYLNYDLTKLTFKQNIPNTIHLNQKMIVKMTKDIIEGLILLAKFQIYPQLKPTSIQFTTSLQTKLFWGNILPHNMHRSYYRNFSINEYNHVYYSPEEIQAIRKKKFNHKILTEKCVVFSLGIILLSTLTGTNSSQFYNYKKKQICDKKIGQNLLAIKDKFSVSFIRCLELMLKFNSKERSNFKEIMEIISKI